MAKLRKKERHRHILTALAANAGMTVTDLAVELLVSKQTIRRDLDELSENGEINRTYGGAASPPVGIEPNLAERGQMMIPERTQIADVAVKMFREGETIMIGPGVSTSFFAQFLAREYQRLQILTNSLSVATIMAKSGSHRVVLIPGDYEPLEGCVTGAETLAFVEKFRADVAVIGASGIDQEGVYEAHSGISWVDRAMLSRSLRNMVLLTDDKFNHPYLEKICSLGDLDALVTNKAPEGQLLSALNDADVSCHLPK